MGRSVRWLVFLSMLVLPVVAAAQRNLSVAALEQRVALVIGNSAYKDSPLTNPVNDATDIANALQQVGFKVILRRNAGTPEMRQAIREFGAELRRAEVGLFYFAGHGIQLKGNNYLVPVGADIESEADAEDLAIDASYALRTMEEAQVKVSIVILDACRNNPFARSFRSSSRGLAQMSAATGSVIAFATAPGSVAADGAGRNGVYTKHLLASLQQTDTDVLKVFQRTRAGVVRETNGKQVPWESTSLIGDFQFKPIAVSAVAAVAVAPAPASPAVPPPAAPVATPSPVTASPTSVSAAAPSPPASLQVATVSPSPGKCAVQRLSFSDGSQACFEKFEIFLLKGNRGNRVVDLVGGKRSFAYAIPAPGSNCLATHGMAWDWDVPERDASRAAEFCEQNGTKRGDVGGCRCTAIVPSSGNVTMTQREFVTAIFKNYDGILERRRRENPDEADKIDADRQQLKRAEQDHYDRLARETRTRN